ncbi:MAG: hypothetical protein ACRDNZ_24555 [Streptosporangiaceae bacterium]
MSRGATRVARTAMVLVLLLTVGGYIALRHSVPVLGPASCDAGGTDQPVSLNVGQAGIAATIAGVAQHRALPPYAVTIAFATALQESKLTNLHSGDLDSVGVFQQRPSEGWGPAVRLEDPVYASTKFFTALSRVRGYRLMPVDEAAQAVQHSADGSAYGQFATVAGRMSAAFTGQQPHAVWCWYPNLAGKPRLAAAGEELARAFGPLRVRPTAAGGIMISVAPGPSGWAVAAWLVSHAGAYGIRHISYGGYQWHSGQATSGWVRPGPRESAQAPTSVVVFG